MGSTSPSSFSSRINGDACSSLTAVRVARPCVTNKSKKTSAIERYHLVRSALPRPIILRLPWFCLFPNVPGVLSPPRNLAPVSPLFPPRQAPGLSSSAPDKFAQARRAPPQNPAPPVTISVPPRPHPVSLVAGRFPPGSDARMHLWHPVPGLSENHAP